MRSRHGFRLKNFLISILRTGTGTVLVEDRLQFSIRFRGEIFVG
jgi:hypothetical protein